jgi:4-amino-4-deoxychorismate lyase
MASETPLKVRIAITEPGTIKTQVTEVPPLPYEVLYPAKFPRPEDIQQPGVASIVLDSVPLAISVFTYHKTSERIGYDDARRRMAELPAIKKALSDSRATEVIVFNLRGDITEGSHTNVYFWRDNGWVTPHVGPDHGGLAGTARQHALGQGLCGEAIVRKESISIGDIVLISNGVRGFVPGIVEWIPGVP